VTVRTRHHNAAAHREEIADQVNTNTTDISTLETQSPTLGTEVDATNSGADDLTSIDFTGIPSWVTKIQILFSGISTSGTSNVMVQIGDSGGVETSGYLGCAARITVGTTNTSNFTTGFGLLSSMSAVSVIHGILYLTLEDSSNNTWVYGFDGGLSNGNAVLCGGGNKSLSAALDRVSITTVGGSDTFDAGDINILYE